MLGWQSDAPDLSNKSALQCPSTTGDTSPPEVLGRCQNESVSSWIHKTLGLRGGVFCEKKHFSRTTLSNTVAISPMGLFKLKLIKMQHNLKLSSLVVLATF